jgi:hypothetical protein
MYSGKIAVPPGGGGIRKSKPDHNRSKLLGHWLVKDKYSKSFLLFKINEIQAAPFGPPYLQI